MMYIDNHLPWCNLLRIITVNFVKSIVCSLHYYSTVP